MNGIILIRVCRQVSMRKIPLSCFWTICPEKRLCSRKKAVVSFFAGAIMLVCCCFVGLIFAGFSVREKKELKKLDAERGAYNQQLQKALDKAKKANAANYLLSLVNDLLQMSKLEEDNIVLAHEPMDIRRLPVDVVTLIGERAAEKGISLTYEQKEGEMPNPYIYIPVLFISGSCF